MAGTPEGARKALETKRRKYGDDWAKKLASQGGAASKTGGFASEKVGRDGLSGKERARVAGSKKKGRRDHADSQDTRLPGE